MDQDLLPSDIGYLKLAVYQASLLKNTTWHTDILNQFEEDANFCIEALRVIQSKGYTF